MLNMQLEFHKFELIRFLQRKDYKSILLFALCFDIYFFYKNLIVSIMVIIVFCSILTSVTNTHFD